MQAHQVFLSIKHQDGRATWVVKYHLEEQEQEVRFAFANQMSAVNLFEYTSLHMNIPQPNARVELVHCNNVLTWWYLTDQQRLLVWSPCDGLHGKRRDLRGAAAGRLGWQKRRVGAQPHL